MPDSSRVAVYLDFDNMVISRYDNLHGNNSWRNDNARDHRPGGGEAVDQRLAEAMVDLGAIIDYASSFGTVALTRAYADWSVPANAAYRTQLIDRAVDLVQLFATSGTKNGADIRLSIDAVDDLVDHADLTHVVIVGGDSDYIALAQRCRRMGRFVVGIGVTGSTSRALVAACDEFSDYADLPGVRTVAPIKKAGCGAAAAKKAAAKKAAPPATKAPTKAEKAAEKATELLVRAIRVGVEKSDDGWLQASSVKQPDAADGLDVQGEVARVLLVQGVHRGPGDVVELQSKDNGQLTVRLR